MVLIAVACLAVLGAGGWWWLRTPAFAVGVNPDRNILLVTIDTLRADALGAYGGRAITPNLDRLAATGARFTFAHAHAVVTLPSHATILTGRYPYEHGIRDNTGYRLAPGQADRGDAAEGARLRHRRVRRRLPARSPVRPRRRVRRLRRHARSRAQWRGWRSRAARRRRRAIGARLDRRAAAASGSPGSTSTIRTRPTSRRRNGRRASRPIRISAKCPGRTPRSAPLFDRLARRSRPTLVVVTGDHGESLGEHGELTHGLFAYESTLRVPLICRGSTAPRRAADATRPLRRRHAGPARRSAADAPRRRRRAGRARPAGRLAARASSRGATRTDRPATSKR